jgi:hypothetical protein
MLAINLACADAYAEMLWEENTVPWLKSSAEWAQVNRVIREYKRSITNETVIEIMALLII